MKVREACLTNGCPICNWNGIVGDGEIRNCYFPALDYERVENIMLKWKT